MKQFSLLVIVNAIGLFGAFAQGENPNSIVNGSLTLVEEYKPKLSDAVKWTFSPDLAPIPTETSKPNFVFNTRKLTLPTVLAKVNPMGARTYPDEPSTKGFLQLGVGLRALPQAEFGIHSSRKANNKLDVGLGGSVWNTAAINVPTYRGFISADANAWLSTYTKSNIEVRPSIQFSYSKYSLFPDTAIIDAVDFAAENRNRIVVGAEFSIQNPSSNSPFKFSLSPNVLFTQFAENQEVYVKAPITLSYGFTSDVSVGIAAFTHFQRLTNVLDSVQSRFAFAAGPFAEYKSNIIEANGAIRIGKLDKFELFPFANIVFQTNGGKARIHTFIDRTIDDISMNAQSAYMQFAENTTDFSIAHVLKAGVGISLKPTTNFNIGAEVVLKRHERLQTWLPKTIGNTVQYAAVSDSGVSQTVIMANTGLRLAAAFNLSARVEYHAYNFSRETQAFHLPSFISETDLQWKITPKVTFNTGVYTRSGIVADFVDSEKIVLDPAIFLNAGVNFQLTPKFMIGAQVDNILNSEAPKFTAYPVFGIQPTLVLRLNF